MGRFSLDFSVMFRCPRFVCSDSAIDSSPVESTHQRKEAQSRTTARSWPLCCLDEEIRFFTSVNETWISMKTLDKKNPWLSLSMVVDHLWCVLSDCVNHAFVGSPFLHHCFTFAVNASPTLICAEHSVKHQLRTATRTEDQARCVSMSYLCFQIVQWCSNGSSKDFHWHCLGRTRLCYRVETIESQRETFLHEQRASKVMQSEFVVDILSCECSTSHCEKALREDQHVHRSDSLCRCSNSSRVVATLHCLDFARYSTKHDNIRWRSLSAERRRACDTVAARTAADMFTSLVFSYLLSMTATLTGRDFLIGLLLEWTLMDDGQDLKPQCDTREKWNEQTGSFSMFDSGHDYLMNHLTPRSSSDEDLLMNLSFSLCRLFEVLCSSLWLLAAVEYPFDIHLSSTMMSPIQ